jgi:hypothetical protein
MRDTVEIRKEAESQSLQNPLKAKKSVPKKEELECLDSVE